MGNYHSYNEARDMTSVTFCSEGGLRRFCTGTFLRQRLLCHQAMFPPVGQPAGWLRGAIAPCRSASRLAQRRGCPSSVG